MRPVEQIVEDIAKQRELNKQGEAKLLQLNQELTSIYEYVAEQLGYNQKLAATPIVGQIAAGRSY